MATHSFLVFSLSFLLLFSSLGLVSIASSSSSPLPQCHDDEASALLQFKQSLTIDMCDPSDLSAYPKLESWNMLGERSNCCSWDGVECHDVTGHVIGLHLSSSCLYGSLSFNISLSKLSKLQHLNLGSNNFSHTSIPPLSGHFSQLTYLSLSYSGLSGFVPPSISQLSMLSFLDLSHNDGLILKRQHFEGLVENLTRLEYLNLNLLHILSDIPKSMLNLSSLKHLHLCQCGLSGQFPAEIFNLPNLQSIFLSENPDLNGYFSQFNSSSPIEYLVVNSTSFNGFLPASIGKLLSLHRFDITNCFFSGQLPTSLENLTQLTYLDLSRNLFEGTSFSTLSWLRRQTDLTFLCLDYIGLQGDIPVYLANLTQLTYLGLKLCQLSGPLPSWLFQMSKLQVIDLGSNQLHGPIPCLLSQSAQLSTLILEYNKLSGEVKLSMFTGVKELHISGNNLSLIDDASTNATLKSHKFYGIGLGSCNLQHFPHFLRDQDQLTWLELFDNGIHGKIPSWMWNLTKDTLHFINFAGNNLTGFELDLIVFPWPQAIFIILNSNMFNGPLPIPPATTKVYWVSRNNFQGEISPKFCTLNALYSLDLSHNNLKGEVPQCLENISASLERLDLQGNNFYGSIPQTYTKDCNLKMLNLNHNNFKGKLPTSLSNCLGLELLDVGDNQIEDALPSWLDALQQLKVFILRSNHFYGELKGDIIVDRFQQLRVIDLSWNNLSGPLPSQYFFGWKSMETNLSNREYLNDDANFEQGPTDSVYMIEDFSMSITNKGVQVPYDKILEGFVAIDFSGNRFEGPIPISICILTGLRLLNLSNNLLTSEIPSSLANLSNLEALDLSQNNLSGEIPLELVRLNFLSFFNVSNNHLRGPIPQGKQFNTFPDDSYQGNSMLCGNPLSKQCWVPPPSSPYSSFQEDESLFHFGWMPILVGYVCGFVFGIGPGYMVYTKKHVWIVKFFGEK